MIKNKNLDYFYNIEKEDNLKREKKYLQNVKEIYGEVYTPLYFVEKILDIIPKNTFNNPSLKWLYYT